MVNNKEVSTKPSRPSLQVVVDYNMSAALSKRSHQPQNTKMRRGTITSPSSPSRETIPRIRRQEIEKVFGKGESDRGRTLRDLYTTNVSREVKLGFYCNISIESRSPSPKDLQIGRTTWRKPLAQCQNVSVWLPYSYLRSTPVSTLGIACFSRVTGHHDWYDYV